MIRARVQYQGRVQGVGFRATTHSIAKRRAVSGWVRNEHDGSVCLEVQGEAPEVEALLGEVRAALARNIHREDRIDVPAHSGEAGFVIAR